MEKPSLYIAIHGSQNMKGGIESLTWIRDKNGKEYVCSLEETSKNLYEDLSEEEKRRCTDVNQIVGTERW